MQRLKSSTIQDSEAESDESTRFANSLKELRELRSQLHYAADYCESTFLNGKEKKDVIENTKEYICRAVVTVVDHVGGVSSNLNHVISHTNHFSQLDLRINSLNQRLFSCEQYAHKLALTKLQWSEILPRYHSRYLSTSIKNFERSNGDSRNWSDQNCRKTKEKEELYIEEGIPLFLYTYTNKSSSAINSRTAAVKRDSNSALVVPVCDGFSVLSKGSNPTFHFQSIEKHGRHRRSIRGSDILSLLRRTKKTS